jgi:hypothetical protein
VLSCNAGAMALKRREIEMDRSPIRHCPPCQGRWDNRGPRDTAGLTTSHCSWEFRDSRYPVQFRASGFGMKDKGLPPSPSLLRQVIDNRHKLNGTGLGTTKKFERLLARAEEKASKSGRAVEVELYELLLDS